jgi:hypothetical protein
MQAQGHRSPVPRTTERSRMTEGTSTGRKATRLLPIVMSTAVVPALGEWHGRGLCVGEEPDVFRPTQVRGRRPDGSAASARPAMTALSTRGTGRARDLGRPRSGESGGTREGGSGAVQPSPRPGRPRNTPKPRGEHDFRATAPARQDRRQRQVVEADGPRRPSRRRPVGHFRPPQAPSRPARLCSRQPAAMSWCGQRRVPCPQGSARRRSASASAGHPLRSPNSASCASALPVTGRADACSAVKISPDQRQ